MEDEVLRHQTYILTSLKPGTLLANSTTLTIEGVMISARFSNEPLSPSALTLLVSGCPS